ncbi:hypothetical protein CFELI_12655 [Corynebacterium felinum]|uniref:Uncharacterized protein n=1 Tax=Corynebacterium felinum TaxID=131318 RepID=A0ABU2B830_9CORY|nr:hypothetical protein [Corynebacterium felinum]WJY96111.1 hypothetical protein CFELI_12655 [Corynebacterium felinum]
MMADFFTPVHGKGDFFSIHIHRAGAQQVYSRDATGVQMCGQKENTPRNLRPDALGFALIQSGLFLACCGECALLKF